MKPLALFMAVSMALVFVLFILVSSTRFSTTGTVQVSPLGQYPSSVQLQPSIRTVEPTHPSWGTFPDGGGIRVIPPRGKDGEMQWVEVERSAEQAMKEAERRMSNGH